MTNTLNQFFGIAGVTIYQDDKGLLYVPLGHIEALTSVRLIQGLATTPKAGDPAQVLYRACGTGTWSQAVLIDDDQEAADDVGDRWDGLS